MTDAIFQKRKKERKKEIRVLSNALKFIPAEFSIQNPPFLFYCRYNVNILPSVNYKS